MYINQVNLLGYLGLDPEVRKSQSGVETVILSLGVTKRVKDSKTGDKVDNTTWFRIKILNQGLVKLSKEYLKKGTRVYISGELEIRKYQDKLGNNQYMTEILLGHNSLLQFANKQEEQAETKTLGNVYD